MDRIHRLGQRRPVQAIKLVVEDSIESRIVQVSVINLYLRPIIDVSSAPRKEERHGKRNSIRR